MRNIRLTLQYDGTDYAGWQCQRAEKTIQSAVEEAVSRLTGQPVKLAGAGRTDAGVHALAQVAAFRTSSALPADTIRRALNAVLPPDIRVASALDEAEEFHPRFDAKAKRYFYLVSNSQTVSPFLMRYVWKVPFGLDAALMREAARHLIGRRDFKAFMASGSGVKDTVREMRSIEIEEMDGIDFLGAQIGGRFLKFSFEGDGFLRHMVRAMVGTLIEIGRGRTLDVPSIMASGQRRLAGPSAPARGLFLERIIYGP